MITASAMDARTWVIGTVSAAGTVCRMLSTQLLVCIPESGGFVFLPAEDFHDLVGFNRLLQDMAQIAHGLLCSPAHFAQPSRKKPDHKRDQWKYRERDESQLPVDVEEPAEQSDHCQRIAHDHGK